MVSSIDRGLPLLTPNLDELGYPTRAGRNVDELIIKIDSLQKNIDYLKEHLKYYNKKRILNIYSNVSHEDRLKRKSIKKDISDAKEVIKENKQMLDKACSFDIDLLANFIANILSNTRKEEYKVKEIILTDQFSSSHFYKTLYFISIDENIDLLNDLYTDNDISTFYKTLKHFSEKDYILIDLDKKYKCYDLSKNKIDMEDFKSHSYVMDAIKKIINVKLNNEGVLDEEICDTFYDKYSIKKKNNTFVKKAR